MISRESPGIATCTRTISSTSTASINYVSCLSMILTLIDYSMPGKRGFGDLFDPPADDQWRMVVAAHCACSSRQLCSATTRWPPSAPSHPRHLSTLEAIIPPQAINLPCSEMEAATLQANSWIYEQKRSCSEVFAKTNEGSVAASPSPFEPSPLCAVVSPLSPLDFCLVKTEPISLPKLETLKPSAPCRQVMANATMLNQM